MRRLTKLARTAATYAAIAYVAVGLVLGSMLYAAIPAMNLLGLGYYAATWPGFVCYGTKTCHRAPPVPRWAFTFRDGRQALTKGGRTNE